MKIFTQFSFQTKPSFYNVFFLALLFFSWNGFSQNLLTNPGLSVASANCTGADALQDTNPDGWIKTATPDRATELQRAFHTTFVTRGPSPSGGCYFGFRAWGGAPEGIGQNVTVVGGQEYSFSFDYLIETEPTKTACTPQLEIILDGTVVATIPPPVTENVWSRPLVTFTAASSGTFLFEFFAGGSCVVTWNFVDNLDLREACNMSTISVANISPCNNNGTTGTGADDYFTADVTVAYTGPPVSGTLDLVGDGTASVAVGSLDSSTSHTFFNVQMPADGTAIDLTASFSADITCVVNNNNAGTAPVSCSVPEADLVTVKTLQSGSNTPDEGDVLVYRIEVTNNGADQATNVSLDDDLPAGVSYVSDTASAGTSYDDATGIWTIGTINTGASVILDITVTVDAGTSNDVIINDLVNPASGDQDDLLR